MRGQLLSDTLATAWEVFAGFALALIGGLTIGLLASMSSIARRTLFPLVTALQSMPKIALAPLLIVLARGRLGRWMRPVPLIVLVAMASYHGYEKRFLALKKGFEYEVAPRVLASPPQGPRAPR